MKDVHTAHCCAKCGCKYGKDDECTVAAGKAPAQYGCEFCEEELDYIKQNIPEGYALVPVDLIRNVCDRLQALGDADMGRSVFDADVDELKRLIAAATETK